MAPELAHAVDYWLVSPDAHERSELLAGSGHGYFSYLPFAVALCVALLVAGLVAVARAAGRGRPAFSLDPWPLAVLPIATFVLQEHLERYLHDGAFPWHAVSEPTFALGLVLQIPFAIAAYMVARLLLRAAEAIGSRAAPRESFGRPRLRISHRRRSTFLHSSRLRAGIPHAGHRVSFRPDPRPRSRPTGRRRRFASHIRGRHG